MIHPSNSLYNDNKSLIIYDKDKKVWCYKREDGTLNELYSGTCTWTDDLSAIKVEYIGGSEFKFKGVICASFNAG